MSSNYFCSRISIARLFFRKLPCLFNRVMPFLHLFSDHEAEASSKCQFETPTNPAPKRLEAPSAMHMHTNFHRYTKYPLSFRTYKTLVKSKYHRPPASLIFLGSRNESCSFCHRCASCACLESCGWTWSGSLGGSFLTGEDASLPSCLVSPRGSLRWARPAPSFSEELLQNR